MHFFWKNLYQYLEQTNYLPQKKKIEFKTIYEIIPLFNFNFFFFDIFFLYVLFLYSLLIFLALKCKNLNANNVAYCLRLSVPVLVYYKAVCIIFVLW